MNNLVEFLKNKGEEKRNNLKATARKRVLDILANEKPLGNREDLHTERRGADYDRS